MHVKYGLLLGLEYSMHCSISTFCNSVIIRYNQNIDSKSESCNDFLSFGILHTFQPTVRKWSRGVILSWYYDFNLLDGYLVFDFCRMCWLLTILISSWKVFSSVWKRYLKVPENELFLINSSYVLCVKNCCPKRRMIVATIAERLVENNEYNHTVVKLRSNQIVEA